MAARHVARRLGLPYVVTFHGSDINSWPSEHPGRLPDLRRTVREAAAVLAVSEALADRVEELSGVRPTHLPIGCDVEGLVGASQPRREARESLGLPQDRYIALFVGRLSPAKGIREFVDAVISLDGVVGVVIGDGPEAGYGPVGTVSRASVTYVGLQPNATVAQYMSAADVLILPSYREGLPTVIVEAGILRLPVIASAVGGIPDLLGSDRGVLLPEISPAAVAEVVRRQMDDREGAAERASRLRDHVLEHHSADANARRLLAIYEAVA
jgi:teichuronic acid biosynthesis glycosyltransferase TuaC